MNMNYQEFLTELFKIKRFGHTPNLLVMQKILDKLDNPHKKLRFIHIAGTNGKGSVSNYIARGLEAQGYKTGLFTSPFIHSFNERFKINGENISDLQLAKIGSMIFDIVKSIPYEVKQFDIITAIAMYWFYNSGCDYVVLEAGMGGRNDSTNIIIPEISVVTTIDLDHTKILGDTIEKIAYEKAGIVKENTPLIYYPTKYEDILINECKLKNSSCYTIDIPEILSVNMNGSSFLYKGKEYFINMLGKHQIYNACLAVEVLSKLNVGYENIKNGLSTMKFEGRFEKIFDKPNVYIDGGHNPQGARSIVETVEFHGIEKPTFIVSVFKEKDALGFLENLKGAGKIILTSFDKTMTYDPLELSRISGYDVGDLEDIINSIKNDKNDSNYIFCGSLYQISKIKSFFAKTR